MKKPEIHQVQFEQTFFVCSNEENPTDFSTDLDFFGIGVPAMNVAPKEELCPFSKKPEYTDGYNIRPYLCKAKVLATKPFMIEESWELQEGIEELLPKRKRKAWNDLCNSTYNYGGNEKLYVHEVIHNYGIDEFTALLEKKGYDSFCWVDDFKTQAMTILVFDAEKIVPLAE